MDSNSGDKTFQKFIVHSPNIMIPVKISLRQWRINVRCNSFSIKVHSTSFNFPEAFPSGLWSFLIRQFNEMGARSVE